MQPPAIQLQTESNKHRITQYLSRLHPFWFTLYASLTAFSLYTCVFAFRKAFTAATFEESAFLGVSYKVWLVTFQVIGYGLSKFIGIKVISELKAQSRALGILAMITIAGLSWLLFAITPKPYNLIFLFTNGFPLGMVWGMVFGYLEGRRTTEVLGAALSVSFIFSAGLCRSVGSYIMQAWHVSETWMPFVTCCLFLLPLLLFLWLLDKVPPPSVLDEELRTKRKPMLHEERKHFLKSFFPGIVLFVTVYVLLTIFRDFRDNFSAEVWKVLGYGNSSAIYTKTEVPVSIAVLVVIGSLMLIKNNKTALMVNHLIIALGMAMIGVSTLLFENNQISPPTWMILIGTGLYLGYVPFNSVFFDRLIAAFNYVGTVGFIMYVADSFGYLGSVGVLLFKEFSYAKLSWLNVFISSGYIVSVSGGILILCSATYFHFKHKIWKATFPV
ncbi:DUF5690 family protein [Chryseosolibacter indicus]|uniref:MFS transporter n=1 Tax=Chryseosolibacter indicus TaxID=2782351 RepID=A0ABS5VN75_9BACT|nr:DUF5690 family protein [Chryseosolibacter indicus]MBT1702888.1 hypothetical protein [Chryseosolibacter indicus]